MGGGDPPGRFGWYEQGYFPQTGRSKQKALSKQAKEIMSDSPPDFYEKNKKGHIVKSLLLPLLLCLSSLASAFDSVYPDPSLTPGAVYSSVTERDVCTPGYAKRTRKVSVGQKKRVFKRYGIAWEDRKGYEVDHFMPLSIGGSNDLRNLWPEPWGEAHKKDKVEDYLYHAVCHGRMTISEAQCLIRKDWVKVYEKIR